MSARARARLGAAGHLPEAFAEVERPALRRYLEECKPGDTLAGLFLGDREHAVPVQLSCVIGSARGLVLSAEIRERTADHLTEMSGQLVSLQNRILQSYFRLLRRQQALDGRCGRSRPNRSVALGAQLDRERARLARELHSGAGQSLSAISVHVELIEKQAPPLPAEIRCYLKRIALLAREAGAEVRAVSHRLHPPDWQALGLAEALRNLWDTSGIPEQFQACLKIDPLPAEPPHAVRLALYRIAQEGIANAIHHSSATHMALTLEANGRKVRMRIEDNGKGFDATSRPSATGIGLRTIRDQVRNLDGNLNLTSGPNGTKLEVSIPLEPSDE